MTSTRPAAVIRPSLVTSGTPSARAVADRFRGGDEAVPRITQQREGDRLEGRCHAGVDRYGVERRGRVGEQLGDRRELFGTDGPSGLGDVPKVDQCGDRNGDAFVRLGGGKRRQCWSRKTARVGPGEVPDEGVRIGDDSHNADVEGSQRPPGP